MDGTAPLADRARLRPVLLIASQSFFVPAGTPINVMQMCRALGAQGYQVHLLTLPYGEELAIPNVVHHRAPRLPFIARIPVGFSAGKAVHDLVLAAQIIGLLMRRRFCAVHAIEEAAFFAVPIARLFGVAAIADLDSDICDQLRNHRSRPVRALAGLAGLLRRAALRRSTCAITVAEALTHLVATSARRHLPSRSRTFRSIPRCAWSTPRPSSGCETKSASVPVGP